MWMMMGCNNDGSDFTMSDSFDARKLRPFAAPRPPPVVSSPTNLPCTAPPPCFSRIHGTELFAINHHHHLSHLIGEQSKREYNTSQSVVVSSRWNPTPEQLRTLEDLYRRGTRTPSADQIGHITSQLRRFGKIEGKNVFYWFQNHKARERQKRRRQLEAVDDDHCGDADQTTLQKKEPGESKAATGFEVGQTKNWEPVQMHRPEEKTATKGAECAADEGWTQFDDDEDDGEVQLRRRTTLTMAETERNSTWQQSRHLYSSPPISTSHLTTTTTNNNNCNFTTVMTTVATPLSLASSYSSASNDPNLTTHDELTFYLSSHKHDGSHQGFQTLELFPLSSNNGGHVLNQQSLVEDDEKKTTDLTTSFQFIEFLPLKN